MYVDLGAKRLILAEREVQKIAVEVKSFVSDSEMQAFRDAIGQFTIYRSVLRRTYPEYALFLAVRDVTYHALFEEPIGQLMIEDENLKIIVLDAEKQEILQWKS
jgi:XisH protein